MIVFSTKVSNAVPMKYRPFNPEPTPERAKAGLVAALLGSSSTSMAASKL